MGRSTLAERGKTASRGRRQHFAEGPFTDGGPYGRNDLGEQAELPHIVEEYGPGLPGADQVSVPEEATHNISNTEQNLVANLAKARNYTLAYAQQLAELRKRQGSRRRKAELEVATEVNPSVNTGPAGEALTGDSFESANPDAGVKETQPHDASLRRFQVFDRWLSQKTGGKRCRDLTSAAIRRAAEEYSMEARMPVQAMFPALGIVLREARKVEAARRRPAPAKRQPSKVTAKKGTKMRKRADEKLEVAAPDDRIDVETPVADVTDAEAQASQFDLSDFGNNASDNVADPDLSTDQNWPPGEAKQSNKHVAAGGILAVQAAEAYINAGLAPASEKYAMARQFEGMARGIVRHDIALLERVAANMAALQRQVASGASRGATKSPIPRGLSYGGQPRTAAVRKTAANDPSNDSLLFG